MSKSKLTPPKRTSSPTGHEEIASHEAAQQQHSDEPPEKLSTSHVDESKTPVPTQTQNPKRTKPSPKKSE